MKRHRRISQRMCCTYIYVYIYIYICVCMYVCLNVCMCVCMHACMSVCMYVRTHVRMCVCMYACMHVCMHYKAEGFKWSDAGGPVVLVEEAANDLEREDTGESLGESLAFV